MLVTYDRDFWDDNQFPIRSCAGILRLPDIGHDLDFFWSIVTGPLGGRPAACGGRLALPKRRGSYSAFIAARLTTGISPSA